MRPDRTSPRLPLAPTRSRRTSFRPPSNAASTRPSRSAVALHEGTNPPPGSFDSPAAAGHVPHRASWWPFQLHYGGAGTPYEQWGNVAGMGNDFTAQTGWQPGDPRAWKDCHGLCPGSSRGEPRRLVAVVRLHPGESRGAPGTPAEERLVMARKED